MKITELKKMIQKAKDTSQEVAEVLEGDSSNPTIKENYIKAKAETEILQAILDAINGNSVMLNLYCEG